jgi:pimeloyl-ACP methyl ester carboxylesterase
MLSLAAAAVVALTATDAATASTPPSEDDIAAAFGSEFDPIGSPIPVSVDLPDGSHATIVDTGPEGGTPVLFIGGAGTSATVVGLFEFHSSAREALNLRMISIDRDGYGDSEFDPQAGYAEFATTALAVLDQLGVDRFSIVAISGGGPYAAAVASAAPDRIRSVHLVAAYTGDPIAGSPKRLCDLPPAERASHAAESAADPAGWWAFSDESSVNRIDGFLDAATADAVRAFHVAGTTSDPAPLAHEFELFCVPTIPDVAAVDAPVFLYFGDQDPDIPPDYADEWAASFPNVIAQLRSPGANRDVQYRHWAQVLVDLASPDRRLTLVCVDGRSLAVPPEQVPDAASYGSCAWVPAG